MIVLYDHTIVYNLLKIIVLCDCDIVPKNIYTINFIIL